MDGFQGNGRMPIYESFRTTQYTIAKLNIKLSNGKKSFLIVEYLFSRKCFLQKILIYTHKRG